MPDESEFAPDLSKLDNRYQILSELRRAENGRTFLARHTGLNRDVTIDVVRVPRGDDEALRFLASDAELLSSRRHAHVIPVIEGRWLGDDAFAIVRPRVRGSTLTQLISALGTIPTQRMSGILEQVHNALEWARTNDIVNRSVAPDDIVLQQGSGRVLVAFGRDPERPSCRMRATMFAPSANSPGQCWPAVRLPRLRPGRSPSAAPICRRESFRRRKRSSPVTVTARRRTSTHIWFRWAGSRARPTRFQLLW